MIGMRRGLDSIGIIGVGQFELFGVVEGLGLWVVRVRMWWGGFVRTWMGWEILMGDEMCRYDNGVEPIIALG